MRDHCRAAARRRTLTALGRMLAYGTVARATVPELADGQAGGWEMGQAHGRFDHGQSAASAGGFADFDEFTPGWALPQGH